jgi:hypothetical protein
MVTVILEKNNEAIRKKQETARKVPTLKSVSKGSVFESPGAAADGDRFGSR